METNAIFCRGFENCKGRSLADFQSMVEATYRDEIPYMVYMNALKMFEGMRKAYLESKVCWLY